METAMVRGSREIRQIIRDVFPENRLGAVDGPSLEVVTRPNDPARMKACAMLESDRLRTRRVAGEPEAAFAAFLDGVQESHALHYADGVPIILGRVAAVIRVRIDRRMTTWQSSHREESRVYAPRALLDADWWTRLEGRGLTMVDTLDGGEPPDSAHPYELVQKAIHAVQKHRQHLECGLAEAWCATTDVPLYVDGGLPDGERSSAAPTCIGVVKSHHTLYGANADIPLVLSLAQGERSSVFLIERSWGQTVASWYLRLRGVESPDPMWGLVRIEVAVTPVVATSAGAATRADEVSRWVLAERSPLSLPDSRWASLAYGVHDCEQYLRAIAH
jgi:hypothetical protein